MFGLFRGTEPAREAARLLHEAIATRARAAVFHTLFMVPDTIDGRFDLFTLHAFLVLEALKQAGDAGSRTGGRLANFIFEGFEEALRELGVGDVGLSRRIKAMADAFYGRLAAYEAARDEPELAAALLRNLYRGREERGDEARALAHYILATRKGLARQDLLKGEADFGHLPRIDMKENAP